MAADPGRWIVFTAILAVVGCSDPDRIRSHSESTQPRSTAPSIPADQKKYRTLVAMVPADGAETGPSWWFLKLSGPAAVIEKYEADFDKLFNSLAAKADERNPIIWDLPSGWKQEMAPPGGMRFATLKSPGGDLDISVTKFSGSVLANAQRWWGELWGKDKVMEFTVAMLPDYVHQRTVNGRLILRVDMSGPNEPPKRPMMMNPHGDMNPHGGME